MTKRPENHIPIKREVETEVIVNKNSLLKNKEMLNWTRKDAQLASKRCPFEVLLTPF